MDATFDDMPLLQNSLKLEALENDNRGSNGIGYSHINGHCNPTYAIIPHAAEVTRSLLRHNTPPRPCVEFEGSQTVTVTLNQECNGVNPSANSLYCPATINFSLNPQQEDLLQQLANSLQQGKRGAILNCIQELDPDTSADLIGNLGTKMYQLEKSDLLNHFFAHTRKSQEELQSPDPGIKAVHNSSNNGKPASVGGSITSDRVEYCGPFPTAFGDILIEDSDRNPFPKDTFPPPVPSPIPHEIQALVDAHTFGKPLTVIVSNERLNEHWALNLPREYGYIVMGFYKIIDVEV